MNKLTLVQTRGNVDLNNYPVEDVSDNTITQLFNIGIDDDLNRTLTEGVDTSSVKRPITSVLGSISVQAAYSNLLEYLQDKYPNLKIASRTEYIWFDDPEVRSVLLNRITHSGEGITATECLAVTNMKDWFNGNQLIDRFDEFDKFINLNNTTDTFRNSKISRLNLSRIKTISSGFCNSSLLEGTVYAPLVVGSLGSGSFRNTKITEVTNLGSITSIDKEAFKSCIFLLSVTIPSTCKTINFGAFDGCSSLSEVIGFDSIEYMQGEIFYGISGLASGLKNSEGEALCSQSYDSQNANLTSLGGANFQNLKEILREAFRGIGLYGYINLPSCTKISGFNNNPLIEYVNAPNAKFEYSSSGAFDRAFWNCTGLVGITMAPNQTRINGLAFDGCTSLTTLDFQGGSLQTVITFDSFCFSNCRNLNITNSDILNAVTIGNGAFSGEVYKSSSLILSHLTFIGLRAFLGNPTLEVVDLTGSNITKLPAGAFDLCNITSITLPNTVIEWGDSNSSQPIQFKSNSNVSLRGIEKITTVNGLCSTENSSFINPICLYYYLTGPRCIIGTKQYQNTYAKLLYLPSFKKDSRTSYDNNSGKINLAFFCYRIEDDGSYRFRINTLYFKDLEEIKPFMFFGCYPKNLVINNVTPPSFGTMPTNSYYQSSISVNYTAWSTKMFGSIPTTGANAMTIYVPDTAISAYQAISHYNQYNILGMSNLTRYTDEAAWVAGGSPDDCLIEAYMAPPSNNS